MGSEIMLPKELLEVRKSRGKIFPKFAGDKDYALAERIIKIFKAGKGKKYGSVLSALKSLENAKNYKKVRGFAKVMENFCVDKACVFDVDSNIDPADVRLYLFERGYVTTKKERQRIIEYAAKYFNTTPDEIEKAMFADRDEELILVDVRHINADTLIRLYNLSLLQTTLFNALRLTFWISSNHKEVFRRIKWLGLMYDLYGEGETIVEITGTASILRMTRKYGTSMAKLIPSVVKAERWWIRAEIIDDSNKIYILEMDDRHKYLFPEYEEKVEYDSSLEEGFARKIKAIKPEVEVIREPGVIKAGKHAFIPDFLIRKGEKEVYVEIVGFWTPEYIKRKIEKVKEAKIPMVVVARKEFGEAEEARFEESDVILFSKKIPYSEVVKKINEHLRESKIEFEGDVINLGEVSSFHGVSMAKVRGLVPERYVLAGNYAVKKDIFEKLCEEVERVKPERLADVMPVLKKYGVGYDVLEAMGYRIRWIGLSEEDAIVKKN